MACVNDLSQIMKGLIVKGRGHPPHQETADPGDEYAARGVVRTLGRGEDITMVMGSNFELDPGIQTERTAELATKLIVPHQR